VTRLALRELAQRLLDLDQQLKDVTRRLRRITQAIAPGLVAIKAVGPDTASTLLMAAGDNPDRLRTESAFAALCGSNPIPASSGKTNRHRLNRGGDRQANGALWRIVFVRRAAISAPATTSPSGPPKARPRPRSCVASRGTSSARSTPHYPEKPQLTVGASLQSL
jgi:transposase